MKQKIISMLYLYSEQMCKYNIKSRALALRRNGRIYRIILNFPIIIDRFENYVPRNGHRLTNLTGTVHFYAQ